MIVPAPPAPGVSGSSGSGVGSSPPPSPGFSPPATVHVAPHTTNRSAVELFNVSVVSDVILLNVTSCLNDAVSPSRVKGELAFIPLSAVKLMEVGFTFDSGVMLIERPFTPFHAAAYNCNEVAPLGTVMVISPPALDVPTLIPLMPLTVHADPLVPAVIVTSAPHALVTSRVRVVNRTKTS